MVRLCLLFQNQALEELDFLFYSLLPFLWLSWSTKDKIKDLYNLSLSLLQSSYLKNYEGEMMTQQSVFLPRNPLRGINVACIHCFMCFGVSVFVALVLAKCCSIGGNLALTGILKLEIFIVTTG